MPDNGPSREDLITRRKAGLLAFFGILAVIFPSMWAGTERGTLGWVLGALFALCAVLGLILPGLFLGRTRS